MEELGTEESARLTAIRNGLLPRVLSGELLVVHTEHAVEEVT